MQSNNLKFKIILYILVIIAISMVTSGAFFILKNWMLGIACILLLIIISAETIHLLNSTNRKLVGYFDALRNDDYTIHFSESTKDSTSNELHKQLNQLNRRIQKTRIENQQREQYFQTLLEHVATGIVTFNSKGFVLHANSAARKMFAVEVLTHINQLERINRNLYQAVQIIKPFEQKLVSMPTERGTIELSIKATSFKIKNDELILLSIQDIRNELDEKELDSWMKLIRVLMHEIMNSIAPITSLSESLTRFFTIDGRPALPEEVDEKTIQTTIRGLNVIKEQGNGLMLFVESYRKLTRLLKPDRTIFKVTDLVDRIKVLYFSLENIDKVKLTVTVNPPEIELFADENLISQVLLNLLKNAVEAISNQAEGRIHIVVGYIANRIEICVADNGPGIPPDIMEQIFVPFFTTRENGSGIGLSLSRQIMRLHGGSLHVRSVPGKETVFSLIF